jgi:hypothetical protein
MERDAPTQIGRHTLTQSGGIGPAVERETALDTVNSHIHALRELRARIAAINQGLRGPLPKEGQDRPAPEGISDLMAGLSEENLLLKACHNELNETCAVLGV